MTFDINAFDEDVLGEEPLEQTDDSLGILGTLGDVALGVPRGILGAAEAATTGIYTAADFISGDALPDQDFDFSILGDSKTGLGLMTESIVQFTAGFIPIQRGLATVGRFSKLSSLTQSALAGAATDLTVFQGRENRLTDLITRFPGLSEPIARALAGEDSEIEGRLKNALQGLIIGGALDGLVKAVRYLRAGQVARASKIAGEILDDVPAPSKAAQAADPLQAPRIPDVTDPDALRAANEFAEREAATLLDPEEFRTSLNMTDEETLKVATDIAGGPDAFPEARKPADVIREVLSFEGKLPRRFKADSNARIDVRKEQLENGIDVLGDAPSMTNAELIKAELTSQHLNLKHFEDQDMAVVQRGFEDLFEAHHRADLQGALGLPKNFKGLVKPRINQLSEWVNSDLGGIEDFFGAVTRSASESLAEGPRILAVMDAATTVLSINGRVLMKLTKRLDTIGGSPKDWLLREQHLAHQMSLIGTIKGFRHFFGKGLRFVGRKVSSLTDKQAEDFLEDIGSRDIKRRQKAVARMAELEEGNIAALTKAIEPTPWQAMIQILNTAFVNALVSGPRTQVVNIGGNTALSFAVPMERFVGSKVLGLAGRPGAAAEARKAISTVKGISSGFREAFAFSRRAFRENKPILHADLKKSEVGSLDVGTINSALKVFGKNAPQIEGSAAKQFMRWLLEAGQVPTRSLMSADEGFQQLTARSVIRAELEEKLSDKFVGEALDQQVEDQLQFFLRDGMAKKSTEIARDAIADAMRKGVKDRNQLHKIGQDAAALMDLAIDDAGIATATRRLERNTYAGDISQFVNNHPLTRQIAPFIRTPTNLLSYGISRSPLGLVVDLTSYLRKLSGFSEGLKKSKFKMIQDMASSDIRVQAEVAGRISTAIGMNTFLGTMVAGGVITGRGPSNHDLRNTMIRSGWQPYSIRIGDKWVSYERFDPFATIIGVNADLYTFGQFASSEHNTAFENVQGAVLTAISTNLTNKTFLTGISRVMELFADLEGESPKFLQNHAASFIPNFFNQANQAIDPTMREARGMLDTFMRRLPGFSNTLEPVRDFLGDPIHRQKQLFADASGGVSNFFLPIATSTVSDKLIDRELLVLGTAFEPPKEKLGGVSLIDIVDRDGRTAYDRYQELVGRVRIHGRTLKQTLRRTIKSAEYKRALPVDIDGISSPRVNLLKSSVRRYRRAAQKQLERDLPEVKRQLIQVERQRVDAARGVNSVLFR